VSEKAYSQILKRNLRTHFENGQYPHGYASPTNHQFISRHAIYLPQASLRDLMIFAKDCIERCGMQCVEEGTEAIPSLQSNKASIAWEDARKIVLAPPNAKSGRDIS